MEFGTIPILIQTVPSAAAVIITVILFLKFLERENKRHDHTRTETIQQLENIGKSFHNHTDELAKRTACAIDRSASVIEDNTKIISVIERRMNGKNS